MSRLRPRREQFQPKEICLGKYVSCWDLRKSDAPELMSWGATEPLMGLSCFKKFTQTLPAFLSKEKAFSPPPPPPPPHTLKDLFGLISGRKPLTGKLQIHWSNLLRSKKTVSRLSQQKDLLNLLKMKICFLASIP